MNAHVKNLQRHMRELCLRIGTRHVGSTGEARAADYVEQVFGEQGYTVAREAYPTIGWDAHNFALTDMESGAVFPMYPCFFSNAVTLEDTLLWLGSGELARVGDIEVAGRLCIVNRAGETGRVQTRNQVAEELDAQGAAAAIFCGEHFHAINTKIQRSPFLKKMGAAAIAGETLVRLAALPRDRRYRLVIDAQKFEHTSHNVIARIEAGPRKAVFGAHYDTAPFIQGAADNASGTAALLELARLLKGRTADWSVDFVAFSAEEYIADDCPPGSADYVRRHQAKSLRWFMNFDSIGFQGAETDALQVGFPSRLPAFNTAFAVEDYSGAGDDKAFHAAGIPTLWYRTASPFKRIHTPDDAYETVSANRIAAFVNDAVNVATTLFQQQ
jgi:hypothetical protein